MKGKTSTMDSSPDLSVKLRRGSSDSRDSFYMGFAQGIDSDIEEVTTIQNNPPPPPLPLALDEPPIEMPPAPVEVGPSEPEDVEGLPESNDIVCEEQGLDEVIAEEQVEVPEETSLPIEPSLFLIEQIPPPPFLFDEDEDETNTSVTVIQSKNKTPSSSSSSISSALNELMPDDVNKSFTQQVESPNSRTQSIEAEIVTKSPSSHKSPPSQKSQPSYKSPQSIKSPQSRKSPISQKSPPKKLNLQKELKHRNFDSDSIDSINAMDCKIDDDNRDDSSPTDSMPPAPTPPPLGFPLSLEKR